MTEHVYFNTGDAELDRYLNKAISLFEENLHSTFDATVKDEDKFRKFFLSSLSTFLESANDLDEESGCCIDEVYGEAAFECLSFPDDEDEDDEDEDNELREDRGGPSFRPED